MRVVTYNILDGGEGRADPIAEVLSAQHADVVALIEADNIEVVERIARRLRMDFIHAPGRRPIDQGGHAAAILSRFDIVETVNHAKLTSGGPRSMIEALVRDESGNDWPVVALHLSAGAFDADEARREQEMKAVFETTSRYRFDHRPHLILGDFNCNAPEQAIDPAKCKPATQRAWEANGGSIPRRVVQQMNETGYMDTLAAAHPGAARTAASFSTHHPGQRVDYIFAHGMAHHRIQCAWIETDRLATYASDHYPVGVDIS